MRARAIPLLVAALALAGTGAVAQAPLPDRAALEARLATLPLAADAVPPLVAAALVAQADRDFATRYAAGRLSTITQAVAQLLRGEGPAPGPEQRIAEERALMARLDAAEMLALYANLTFFGRDAFGIEAAAQAWFGTTAAGLAPEQAAFLAALVPAPQRLARPGEAERLKARRDMVLGGMAEAGAIDAAALARARAMPLP